MQPTPEIVDWTTLEVPRAEAEVPEELVQQELDALRNSVAELVPADDREAREGDTLVSTSRRTTGRAIRHRRRAGVAEPRRGDRAALVGARVGDTRSVRYELGDGSETSVDVTVKHVNEKVLPEADDELARSASEFDTLADLRADIEGRIRAALDAADRRRVPRGRGRRARPRLERQGAGPLVEARARELLNGFVRSLANRGITAGGVLPGDGPVARACLTAQIRGEAAQSVARELALEAVAEQAGIAVSDDEVKDLIREQAEASGDDAEAVIADIWAHGQQESLREDLRLRAALDRLAADVKPIAPEQHAAREAIWTPDKEKPAGETKLWTPGSEESR